MSGWVTVGYRGSGIAIPTEWTGAGGTTGNITLQSGITTNIMAQSTFGYNEALGVNVASPGVITYVSANNTGVESCNLRYAPDLTYVDLRNNIINTSYMDQLFTSLNNAGVTTPIIYIYGNPGTATSNISIATGKGWIVDTTTS